jgi:hypothetical protein
MGPSFLKTQELMSFVIVAAIGSAWTLGDTFGLLGVAPCEGIGQRNGVRNDFAACGGLLIYPASASI